MVKVTTAGSKVKSRSYHDLVHLYPLSNVFTMFQLPPPYVSEIEPGQDFKGQGHYGKLKGQIKVTL